MSAPLARWNAADPEDARAALLSCCGSPQWAEVLLLRRPYADLASVVVDAEAAWFALPESQWLAAFACHPRIGERKAEAASTDQFAAWSGSEQAAAQATLEDVSDKLREGNKIYEQRFGFLYIVFANGRTAPELLDVLEARLRNERPAELAEAARQQWEITRLRITRYFEA